MKQLLLILIILTTDAFAQVRIGVIPSLGGPAAEQGKNWLEGAELAAHDLNVAGIPVKLSIEDDQTQPALAATSFNKLSKIDHVQGVIGGTWDFLAEALYPLALRDRIPFVTPSNPKELLAKSVKKNPYIFSNALSVAAEEEAVEKFLRARKPANMAIVYSTFAWSIAHTDMITRVAKRLGIKIVGGFEMPMTEPQSMYKIAAQKMFRLKPASLYLLADYFGLDLFMTELQNFNWSPLIVEAQHVEGAYRLSKNNDKRYENIYGVHPKFVGGDFGARYAARFKHAPGVFSVEGYDAVQFLARAIDAKVNFSDPAAKFSFQGMKGVMRIPTTDGGLLADHAAIVHFQNGVGTELNDGK